MGAIIPALMHRIPSELRTSILEFIASILEFIGPFRLRSYHLNN
ncbi:hypothetical protein ACJIZ3_000459 [Penstemon smallii]|uniref:Uncharacterized protein n=1 Tax=Penstemon smallii TaxID=265156 RepID=A0ABD3R7G0_9LAMI